MGRGTGVEGCILVREGGVRKEMFARKREREGYELRLLESDYARLRV